MFMTPNISITYLIETQHGSLFIHVYLYFRIDKGEKSESKWWYVLMLVFSVIFYVVSANGTILLYVFFTEVS